MKVHKSITFERIEQAMADDNYTGFCILCGNEQGQCEPDARKYLCESCGERSVYGAEEILMQTGGDL